MKKIKRIFRNKYILILMVLTVGVFLGYLIAPSAHQPVESSDNHTSENTVFTCSMHPQIHQSDPGNCPICGMELIPVQDQMVLGNTQAVQLSEYAMKLTDVQTVIVGSETATNEIRLNGKVAINETMTYVQSTHIPGRIEQLFVNFTGKKVNRRQALARIYSPAMVTAQEELLQAYAVRESNPRLFEAAKEKLRNWKIGQAQIDRVLESGQASEQFTINADVNGIVTEKMVELGDYVERGMPIYKIADLSQVWVLFDIYENDMSWIEVGDKVEFTVASFPGETFEGKVEFIDQLLNAQTRVSTARVNVNNENGKLKPGMFVTGVLENALKKTGPEEITVPKSAVLWTGKKSVVYVKRNNGTFELREVVLGPSLGNSYIILEGLEKGGEIVVNGAFTIDAAAQLAGKNSMMTTTSAQEQKISFPEDFQAGLKNLLPAYFDLKDALVSSKSELASENARVMTQKISKINTSKLPPPAFKKMDKIKEIANLIAQNNDLEYQRNHFATLSDALTTLVSSLTSLDQKVYIQRCPMAKEYSGALWLSREQEVRNPYFGDSMLDCGNTIQELGQ